MESNDNEFIISNFKGSVRDRFNRSGNKAKLDVNGSVAKAFHQRGIIPIGVVGRRSARLIVRESYHSHAINAILSVHKAKTNHTIR